MDISEFEVQLSAWRSQFNGGVAQTQLPALFDSCYFCLDALIDPDARRQAKEYVRTLGGQVRSSRLCSCNLLSSAVCISVRQRCIFTMQTAITPVVLLTCPY